MLDKRLVTAQEIGRGLHRGDNDSSVISAKEAGFQVPDVAGVPI